MFWWLSACVLSWLCCQALGRAGQAVTARTAQGCISAKSHSLLPPAVSTAVPSALLGLQIHTALPVPPGQQQLPRTPPPPGAQCSQQGQHVCSALSPHSLPSVPGYHQPRPRLSPAVSRHSCPILNSPDLCKKCLW